MDEWFSMVFPSEMMIGRASPIKGWLGGFEIAKEAILKMQLTFYLL